MHLKTDTASQSHYARVPTMKAPRNGFPIAEKHITTAQFDYNIPMWHKFIYPTDTISVDIELLARLQTQVSVLYDDLYFDLHVWYTPLRLLQTNFSRYMFNTKPTLSTNNDSLTSPKIDFTELTDGVFAAKSLYDYWGYPTGIDLSASDQHWHNYLGRNYNLIWNTNYRDENLQNPVIVDLDDGPDDPNNYVLLKSGKRPDVFTSCLPFVLKGDPPTVPVLGGGDVFSNGQFPEFETNGSTTHRNLVANSANALSLGGAALGSNQTAIFATGGETGLEVSFGTGLAWILVNDLRFSIAVQHLLEGDARGGTRDVEALAAHWDSFVPDSRMQRPEYLGGITFDFDGHIVPQTSATITGETPQANLAQFSQARSGINISHSFLEHGILQVIARGRSNQTYQQGIWRELTHKTRLDWYHREFANIGEVYVPMREIFALGTDESGADLALFGYQEAWYWLRYGLNRVSAEMRSNYAQSLDTKHMAYDFATPPSLDSGFIESFTPISRNIVIDTSVADPVELSIFVKGIIARQLPMYSVPGLSRL